MIDKMIYNCTGPTTVRLAFAIPAPFKKKLSHSKCLCVFFLFQYLMTFPFSRVIDILLVYYEEEAHINNFYCNFSINIC